MRRKEVKKENIIQFAITFAIIILIGVISNYLFTRFDLTSDKRYTLSDYTKKTLNDLDDVVYFKIYLDGDLPAGFKRLQNATSDIIDEFRAYGSENIQFEFIDPAESPDKKTRNEVFRQLYEKGLEPTNLQVKESDGSTSQKIIFPSILISYRGEEIPVGILKNYTGYSPEGNLNASIQALEYELIFTIHRLTNKKIAKIGFVEGHGELSSIELDDIAQSLAQTYHIQRVKLDEYLFSLQDTLGYNNFDLVVIAKPDSLFSEKDKYIIDQFIMNGGNTLWLIDNVSINIDSLAYASATLALYKPMNLDDMLFKYGIRINPNLIQDMQCAVIPVNTALVGQEAKFAPAPWLYFPLISPSKNHTITKNLDIIKSQFVSVIDTVGENYDIKKTIILTSSKYSRAINAPARIDLSIINEKLDPNRFTKSNLPIGVLLEGKFKSVFTNRVSPMLTNSDEFEIKTVGDEAKMIVISDGDIIRNHVTGSGEQREALPLGYDRYTKQTFGNKELLLNCINYLCNNEGLMETRAKEYKLRLLDKPKIVEQRLKWQIINIIMPLIVLLLFGFIYFYFRKKTYSKY
ncbi:MAG: gliding motility-associated ABC transporter substrate-binding protein GldG [Salinivirgaceae bacterium]|nr:gliding motility-associated ABC transporter substrate-binding protein GldG [Salinivirgaceae bacterium]